jgi:hypothetical protein
MRQSKLAAVLVATLIAGACGEDVFRGPDRSGEVPGADAFDPGPDPDPDPDPQPDPDPVPPPGTPVQVTLVRRPGVTGVQRVNFAVPLVRGQLSDEDKVRVLAGTTELRAARRALARYADGSIRSVQLQVDTQASSLEVRIDETPTTQALDRVPVSTTLDPADGTRGPRVWALLPASWLVASGVTGPTITEAAVEGGPLDAFGTVCDYATNNVDKFLSLNSSRDVWLYDRGTAMYRGYVRRGDLVTLESAYRETAIYRAGITGTGTSTRIGVPTAADDLKYHYTQNMAIHYLLTGDERFRERAEDVATRITSLWSSPGYAGGSDFWTERHAGFALLAYVWTSIVSDDRAAEFASRADAAVDAYLSIQATYPTNYSDQNARCFAHHASAHGEGYGSWGCSPWMSAILADGLDAYATERTGNRRTAARTAIVKLGRILAREGLDGGGKPFYWMGIGAGGDEVDYYDEHWGEPAYAIAMAWHHGGRTEDNLRTTALALVASLKQRGRAPHLRSFNWQCRSSVAIGHYLQ